MADRFLELKQIGPIRLTCLVNVAQAFLNTRRSSTVRFVPSCLTMVPNLQPPSSSLCASCWAIQTCLLLPTIVKQMVSLNGTISHLHPCCKATKTIAHWFVMHRPRRSTMRINNQVHRSTNTWSFDHVLSCRNLDYTLDINVDKTRSGFNSFQRAIIMTWLWESMNIACPSLHRTKLTTNATLTNVSLRQEKKLPFVITSLLKFWMGL